MKSGKILANAVVAPGVCRFDCNVCQCKCNQIANGLKQNLEKTKPFKTHKSQREWLLTLFSKEGARKNLPELPTLDYHTPPAS